MTQKTIRPSTFRWGKAILAAGLISVVRLGLYSGGRTLVGTYAGWRQIAGFVVLMLNSIAELGIANALTENRADGQSLTAVLIVVTSVLMGCWWARRSPATAGVARTR